MPKFYETEKFKALDQKWRERLERDGFVDIEQRRSEATGKLYRPRDVYTYEHNEASLDANTVMGPDHDNPQMAENLNLYGTPTDVHDMPEAEWFRSFTNAVHSLPATYKGRAFLVRYSETGSFEASRPWGMSRQNARSIMAKFLKRVGLRRYRSRQDDAPVVVRDKPAPLFSVSQLVRKGRPLNACGRRFVKERAK